MKKIKMFAVIMMTFMFIVLNTMPIYATENNVLNVTKKTSETKYLENDQGYISKTIVDSNAETGEVTMELKLSNTTKETESKAETEVIFAIDNSPSMDFVTESGKTRKEIVISAAKNMVEKLFESSTNLKIGVVKFSGGSSISSASNLMCNLTNKKEDIIKTLDTLNAQSTTGGTNIIAGVTKANNSFSTSCKNKIIVLLTDGVPNYDLNSNQSGDNVTTSTAKLVQENTRKGLINISDSGAYIVSMMTGMSATDGHTDKNGNVYSEESSLEEKLIAVENIFGTSTKPTAGKFYLVKSADIESIVNNDILKDVMEKVQNPINTVKVVDYFPEDITENFEFYVGKPSIGTITEEIDKEENTIEWNIGTLKGNEVATLKYKLKIKDMSSTSPIYNKEIATNEKVILTYKNKDEKEKEVILESSPKIQLTEKKEEVNTEDKNNNGAGSTDISTQDPTTVVPQDTTVAKGVLPNTGVSLIILLSIIGVVIIAIIGLKGWFSYRDIK